MTKRIKLQVPSSIWKKCYQEVVEEARYHYGNDWYWNFRNILKNKHGITYWDKVDIPNDIMQVTFVDKKAAVFWTLKWV